jgi:hypothetical protein
LAVLYCSQPDVNRAEVDHTLRLTLIEYFIRDLQVRVKELDEIKAKMAATEAKRQKAA